MNTVYVVMSNDFPDCVFDEKDQADVYCEMQNNWQKGLLGNKFGGQTIYYRVYSFEINDPGNLLQRRKDTFDYETPTKERTEKFFEEFRATWEKRRRAAKASA